MSEVPEEQEKLNFKRILPIFVIVLIDLLGMTIIIPLMPLYAASYGANAFMIGLLGAAYPVMQFVGAPLLGRLSDRVGRKPVLVISQIGTLVGFLLLGGAGSLWMLFFSRIVDGISGANIATAQAAITDSTTEKTRTQGLGLIGAAFGLGFVIGPVIAFVSLAASGNNYHVPAFVAAGFSLISILLTVFWFHETLPADERGGREQKSSFTLDALLQAMRSPLVGLLLILMFAQQIAFGGFEQLLSLFTLNRLGMNASGNAVLFVFAGIIIVAVQGGLVGVWSRKYGDRWLVFMGLLVLFIGLTAFAFTPQNPVPWYSRQELTAELASGAPTTQHIQVSLPAEANKSWLGLIWALVAIVPISIGGGVLQPSINSLLTKQVKKEDVGGTLGISSALLSAANALAPVSLGALYQWLGPAIPFLTGGVIMGVLYLFARRSLKKLI
jgi:DHA1 family tetracycline resistance protein-like MFS transporter